MIELESPETEAVLAELKALKWEFRAHGDGRDHFVNFYEAKLPDQRVLSGYRQQHRRTQAVTQGYAIQGYDGKFDKLRDLALHLARERAGV